MKHLASKAGRGARITCAVALMMVAGAVGAAETLDGQQTYDLLFREGTLSEVGATDALRYDRAVTNALKPETATRDSGEITLSFVEDAALMAQLRLDREDGKHRGLGRFPASVGNPMIMYFYESVVRDMAESAGGSPFYIRNRVKDSLIQPSEAVEGSVEVNGQTVATQTVTLYPFAEDPNRAQMQGWGDLELKVTMSEEVPGWYVSLVADVPGADTPVYHSAITFDGTGRAEGSQ